MTPGAIDDTPRLPSLLWLWAPPAIVAAQLGTKLLGEDVYRGWMRGERGLVENLTVAFLVAAVASAVACFRMRARVRSRLFGPFMVVMALGCFFFAGEEASWGQHWLGFTPPESIAERNEQGEFNVHNDPFFELILDQPPRMALTLAALIGGVIVPLIRRRRGLVGPVFSTPGIWGWIWPTIACLPAGIFANTVSLPKKAFAAVDRETPYYVEFSPGETKEFCLALFLLVYLGTMWLNLRAAPEVSGDPREA